MKPENDPLCGNSITGLFAGALDAAPVATTPEDSWQPPEPEHLAALLPQYQITGIIGRGGMGVVYRGAQISLNRAVAVKLLPAELSVNADFVDRFRREAQTLASLSHQGIVTIYDFGQTSERHLYFVMEFIDGTDLAHVLHGQRLEADQALEITIQICEALHYAHSQGVVHRDIKPANVLLTRSGRAKLADFGLARPLAPSRTQLTATNMRMGTPDYMAPEQWTGKADQRADIYALGVMLYEMLTGTKPQGAFDLPSIKAHVDSRLDEVVVKAMRQEPERRYQQVSELRHDVERIRTTQPPQADAPQELRESRSPTIRPAKRTKQSAFDLVMLGVAVAVLGALGVGALVVFGKGRRTNNGPDVSVPGTSGQAITIPPAGEDSPPRREPVIHVPKSIVSEAPRSSPAVVSSTMPVAATPANLPLAPQSPSTPPAAPVPEVEVSKLDIVSQQAPNAINWSLSPLESEVPGDIRQNLTLLREDLVDEGKTKPGANLDAYRAAYFLCDALVSTLDERDKARVAAGYRNAQAAANQAITSPALEARRNYMMSWPQYAREKDQRAELQNQGASRAALAGEAQKLNWSTRAAALRRNLDALYAKFRAARR